MKDRIYQGVQLSKKESELVQWLQKGEHTWVDACMAEEKRRLGLTIPWHDFILKGYAKMCRSSTYSFHGAIRA